VKDGVRVIGKRETAMGQTHHLQLNRQAYEWAKLIRKLRWIGLEDEAHHLQLAMCGLPPHERYAVLAGPFSTV
jgi:hypothetical protein